MRWERTVRPVAGSAAYGAHVEAFNAVEVRRIRGIQGQILGECNGSDHGVVRTGLRFSANAAERRRDAAERTRSRGIEGQRFEIRFRLLQVGLPMCPFGVSSRHERPHRKLSKGDRCDVRPMWQRLGVALHQIEQN